MGQRPPKGKGKDPDGEPPSPFLPWMPEKWERPESRNRPPLNEEVRILMEEAENKARLRKVELRNILKSAQALLLLQKIIIGDDKGEVDK